MDATRPQPGAPPLLTVADIARGMGLSDFYGAGLRADRPDERRTTTRHGRTDERKTGTAATREYVYVHCN